MIAEYFCKIKAIRDLLQNLGSPTSDEDLVTHAVVKWLDEKYDQVLGIIRHRDPFPDLDMVHRMSFVEETRLNTKIQKESHGYEGSLSSQPYTWPPHNKIDHQTLPLQLEATTVLPIVVVFFTQTTITEHL